jgi:hypothetical protein
MNASRFLTAAALLLVTGCIPAYVNPTRDDAAHLTIEPKAKGVLMVNAFANGKECRTRLNLAGSGTLKEKTEIRVTPDEEFTVLALLSYASWNCDIAVSFLPRPREVYTAVIDGDGTKCRMAILRFDGKNFVAEPSVHKRSWRKALLSEDEAQCR